MIYVSSMGVVISIVLLVYLIMDCYHKSADPKHPKSDRIL